MDRFVDSVDLMNTVLNQIKQDVLDEDMTAIEELLKDVPVEQLIGYLPEGTISKQ